MKKRISNHTDFLKCMAFPVPNYNNLEMIKPSCKNIITQNYCGNFSTHSKEEQDIEIWKTNIVANLVGITLINESKEKLIVHIFSEQLEIMIVFPRQTYTFTGSNVKSIKIIYSKNISNILEGEYFIQATFYC
ncbi:S-Ena type endospore appendage [Bacillus bombysepticus]